MAIIDVIMQSGFFYPKSALFVGERMEHFKAGFDKQYNLLGNFKMQKLNTAFMNLSEIWNTVRKYK